MSGNEDLIRGFYEAFARGDHATMAGSYHDEATFSDPVFPALDADGVRAMWRMFCTGGNEIELSFGDIRADDSTASAHWEAIYSFPKTGRRVHNKIDASFTLRDGLIVRHEDRFDLYGWTRMALGPLGTALGWTPMVKKQVRAQAAAQLGRFRSTESET